jgi:uncharacterized repeat protein (TIGR03803 family)
MKFFRMGLLLLCSATLWAACLLCADASARSRVALPNAVSANPLNGRTTVRPNDATYQVRATYTAGTIWGLFGANGVFYAFATDTVGGNQSVPDLLKLTPQGGIIQHAANLPSTYGQFQPGVFVNNTLYGSSWDCSFGGQACLYVIGDGRFQIIYQFLSPFPLGDGPIGLLTYANGNFYGVSIGGGTADQGAVYEVTAAGSGRVLHNFDQAYFINQCYSNLTPITVKVGGMLYGIAESGGAFNAGFFYAIDLVNDSFRVLHSFGGRFDAASPCALVDANGVLYGISNFGDHNYGTLFTISLGGFSSVVHAFSFADGARPLGLLAANGKVFGVSSGAFQYSNGTVWEYSSSGFRVLYAFPPTFAGPYNGALPQLVYTNGTLYGVTAHAFFAITGV